MFSYIVEKKRFHKGQGVRGANPSRQTRIKVKETKRSGVRGKNFHHQNFAVENEKND
jgi:hypothetical protein